MVRGVAAGWHRCDHRPTVERTGNAMGRWVGQPTTVPNRRPSPEVTAAAATPMPSWRRPLAPTTPAPLADHASGPNARPPRRRRPTSPAHPNRAGRRGGVQAGPFAGQQVSVDHLTEQGVTEVVAVLAGSGH